MSLAIFDLDNTLLAGDSDYLWGYYLAEQGVVDRAQYEHENRRYYQDYQAGRLDILEFLSFALKPLTTVEPARLLRCRERFIETMVRPMVAEGAPDLLRWHRERGETLMIITATNSFITRPIADMLGVENLLATEPEMGEGRFTGRVAGTPCFREGKVERLRQWLRANDQSLAGSWFYSDSHNDIPLLREVQYPVAVDPDAGLAETARMEEWPVISLREPFSASVSMPVAGSE
jgi:HAD superfamily hydrolase (TIGR01490 family)